MDNGNEVKLSYDNPSDILYASVNGRSESSHYEDDDLVLVRRDKEQKVIGVTITRASCITDEQWMRHPTRAKLPTQLAASIDNWIFTCDSKSNSFGKTRRSKRDVKIIASNKTTNPVGRPRRVPVQTRSKLGPKEKTQLAVYKSVMAANAWTRMVRMVVDGLRRLPVLVGGNVYLRRKEVALEIHELTYIRDKIMPKLREAEDLHSKKAMELRQKLMEILSEEQ
jgi:uncharacterized protein YuzE